MRKQALSLHDLLNAMFAFKMSAGLEAIMREWPGSWIEEVLVREVEEDNGFGQLERKKHRRDDSDL